MPSPKTKEAAIKWAKTLLLGGTIILDLETTSVRSDAEIVQVGIIDSAGNTLLDTLVKPAGEMGATEIHGITEETVANASAFEDVYPTIAVILKMYGTVVAYNSGFDRRVLKTECERYDLVLPEKIWTCAMWAYGAFYSKPRRRYRLTEACHQQGIDLEGLEHNAINDCLATLAIIRKMAEAADDA